MSDWSLEFARVSFLALLATVPLVLWLARGSLAGLGRGRRMAAVALRSLAVVLVVLALARLRLTKTGDDLCVYFIADRSYSILPEAWDEILETVEEVQGKLRVESGDRVGLILFGRESGVEVPARDRPIDLRQKDFQTLIRPEATDIQSAIRLAVAAFPEGVGGRRVVVFTDGNENRGDVLTEVRDARSLGVTVDVVPVRSPQPAELWVEKVSVAPEVRIGQPFDLQVVVNATAAGRARIRLYENDTLLSDGGMERDLQAGKNVFTVRGLRRDEPGFHRFEVRVEPLDKMADRVTQNNRGSAFVLIAGEPRVLVCLPSEEFEEERRLEAPLLGALAAESIAVDVLPSDLLPRDAGEYLGYDAIVFSNVGAHELTEERMRLLHGLVEGVGIGFVMIGGRNSFGAGGYQGSPIERLLPVDMDVKQRKVLPNGALALVVHSCELGNGNWWARQVVQKAIRVLSPRDYCGVLFHDDRGGERWLFPMTQCSQKQLMLSRLRGFNPGDMMSFQKIFRMALDGLRATPASVKHIVILSDGDPGPPNPADVQAIVSGSDPITISTICYGAHGATIPPIMRDLANKGNGKFYHLRDPRKLPEIFIREAATVRRSLISNDPFPPGVRSWGPILQGFRSEALPTLGGYVLTTAKPLADVLIVRPPHEEDPAEDPVLATWNYGLGKAVAFTSDARVDWGERWVAWGGYQKFWSQLVRWVARSRAAGEGRVSRQVRGEAGKVVFDAIDEVTGELDSSLAIRAKVVSPDHETSDVTARQTRPGRYELDVPADREGTYTVTLRYEKDGVERTYTTGLTVPYSPEFRYSEPDAALLRRVAEAGTGRFVEGGLGVARDVDFFSRDFPRSREVRDIWQQLLTLGLLIFFLDVLIRRVVIDGRAVARRIAAIAGLGLLRRKPAAKGDEELAALLRKKAETRERQVARTANWEPSETETPRVFDAAFDASATTPQPAAKDAKAERRRGAPKGSEEGATGDEASYTSRLLAAKRRALQKGRDRDETRGE